MNLKTAYLLVAMSVAATLFARIAVTFPTESYSTTEEPSTEEAATWEAGSSLFFSVDDMPDEIGGMEVLSEFLPDGIEVEWTGKKLKVPKAGKVKYSKAEEDFVSTSEENPCGLKLKVSKKGVVSGSFKIYVEKSETKVKAYTAKVSGTRGGTLRVKVNKAGSFTASLD